ncbi:P-II family nitrogen regulator [Candidatus Dependentiae bacterium]|nr:P-II family nitrogen regulator [Candidatus Dependentiae bacterium]
MIMLICIFRPDKLDLFKQLAKKLNIPGATLTKVLGFGRQKGHIELFRGDEYEIEFIEKIRAEIVVFEEDVNALLEQIRKHLRTGRIGDGKVFLFPITDAVRIRTGEQGSSAI